MKSNRLKENKKGFSFNGEQDVRVNQQTKIVKAHKHLKRFLKYFAIVLAVSYLPLMLFVLMMVVIILGVLHHVDYDGYANAMVGLHVVQNKAQLGSFLDDVLKAMEAVLYVIFIKPILWLIGQVSAVINFMGNGIVSSKLLFGTSKTFWNVPIEFWIVLFVAVVLIAILLIFKMFYIMQVRYELKGVMFRNAFIATFSAVVVILLLPAVFIVINYVVVTITSFIIKQTNQGYVNLGLWVFNSSFDNGLQHFTSVPDAFNFPNSDHFSYIICLFAEGFMVYILFLITINLFTRVFELLLLYCVAPLVVASGVGDSTGQYKTIKNWISITMQRFILFSFIYLAYNVFLSSVTLFASIAKIMPSTATRPIFILLGIFGGGVVVIKAPSILNALVGGEASLIDSLGHVAGLGVAGKGFIAGGGLAISGTGKLIKATTGTANASTRLGRAGLVGLAAGTTARTAAVIRHPIKTTVHASKTTMQTGSHGLRKVHGLMKKHYQGAIGFKK